MARGSRGNGTYPPGALADIYSRYSSENQRDQSIADQNRICAAEIARQGWQTGCVHSDHAVTGSSSQRRGYQMLLDRVSRRLFKVLVAESLDRLSRDQEDLAALYKRCKFSEIGIYTLAEGWITELHVGLKGTMGALYIVDLADKTHRGLQGRIEAGASAGGLSYGYDVVAVAEGEDRGERRINEREAGVVRRIFDDYGLRNLSPKKIAAALNHEGVPGPRGGTWSQSTINGNRARGTGILHNELYNGILLWNRLRYMMNPDTGKRVSQPNPEDQWVRKAVPNLRIISDVSWDAVRARIAKLDASARPAADESTFQSKQRPTYLLSGLLRCGACGGGMSVLSATHVGCSNARNKGEAICANRRTIMRKFVETTVLDALRTRLMAPEVYAAFVRGFTAEWNSEQKERAVTQEGQQDELKRLERKIDNFVGVIGDSGGSAAILTALRDAEARKMALEAELAVAEAPAPRLMPNLSELYREKVAALQEALAGEDAAAARERIRALIDEVRLLPSPADPKSPLAVEVRGELAAMLALGSSQDEAASSALASQIKLVAGAGFEPAAFRL